MRSREEIAKAYAPINRADSLNVQNNAGTTKPKRRRLKNSRHRWLFGVGAFITMLLAFALWQLMSAGALVGTVYPDGDVTRGWPAVAGTAPCSTTAHWDCVNEATNDITDYVNTGTAGTTGDVEEYTMTSVAASVLDISSVAVKVNANSVACNGNAPNCDTLSMNIRVNGTLQTAQTITLTTTNTEYTTTFTGSWSSDSNLQVQITRNVVGGGNQANADDDVRLTNVKADVTYVVSPNTTQGSYRWFNPGTVSSVPTSQWAARNAAADIFWSGITYGNNLYAAVAFSGTGNRVMTSSDGITWTSRSSANDNLWASVVHGNNMFVAVAVSGTGNRVMTSPDGITWTARTSAADNDWRSVTYGNGLFVAVASTGTGNRVMTSPDGITWTSRTSAADNDWRSVTYGNGLFVAVGISGTGNRVMTSPDGITWTTRTPAGDNSWHGITYGNGLFVAVAATGTGNRVMTSPDGITWTYRTSAADNTWYAIAYGDNYFVAVSGSGTGNRVMTSPDGITWTSRTSAADNSWLGVTHGNGRFVAVAETGSGNRVMTNSYAASVSTPLATQDTATTAPTDNVRLRMNLGVDSELTPNIMNFKMQYANKTGGVCGNAETYYDIGTANWTARTSAADNFWNSATYGNGLYVAVGNSGTGNRVMTSPDGITWTARTSAADNSWSAITYGNGLFVAVAYSGIGNRVMTSPDGITWTSRSSAADSEWYGVTYANGLFVAVGASGTGVMTSPDGITWTSRSSAVNNEWGDVTYGNGLFVAVAYSGIGNRVMTSPDGITWTARTSAADNSWFSVTYGNGLFVAVAYSGIGNRVMTSPDGITWTARTSAADNDWRSVTYGNGLFVAVASTGTGNRVMTSPDGITWTARTSAADNNWIDVTYANGLFVAVAATGTGNRVMTMSPAAFLDGAATNHNAGLVASANDPAQGGSTIRDQSYITLTSFTNDKSALGAGEFGRWDFPVNLKYADRGGSYCFRAVKSDGSLLTAYNFFPEIAVPALNAAPAAPTLSAPAANASSIGISPTFQLRTTDADSDYLRYLIDVCSNSTCSVILRTINQTSSQVGWTGQDTQTGTAYIGNLAIGSSTLASHTYQAPALSNSTQYWWRASAIDPGGSNTWSPSSGIQTFTTAAAAPIAPVQINGGLQIRGGTRIGN